VCEAVNLGLISLSLALQPPPKLSKPLHWVRMVWKLFPAEMISPAVVKSMRAVLPRHIRTLFPWAALARTNMADYRKSGASGFGIGSALYAPGRVGTRAVG
jgi:2-dehydro-3-deoxyphosphogalactonate aldolase